jgi:hypothetical protein
MYFRLLRVWNFIPHWVGRRSWEYVRNLWMWKKHETGENYITRSLIISTCRRILLGQTHQGEGDGRGMWHEWESGNFWKLLVEKQERQTEVERLWEIWDENKSFITDFTGRGSGLALCCLEQD